MYKEALRGYALLVFLLIAGNLWAVEVSEDGNKKSVTPDRVSGLMKIDGLLEERVWQQPPINKVFKSQSPNYGDPLTERTEVWAAYDSKNLYFAFKCYDSEPEKIKTSISQRDNIAKDDIIGVLLDAPGNRQTNYEFYVNPSGIQWDAITSAVSGSDQSPDFVWDSAGKLVPEGYQIEIRIPLSSLRYQAGKETQMGVIFVRQISRLGVLGTWPELHPGQTDFNFMASITYHDLGGTLKLEVLPNFTYSKDSERKTSDSWEDTNDSNFGVGLKYGITTSMTVEATWNPDFSQVESDVFQAEVNLRYPVFFTEKRPFFMESKEVLDFGIIDQGMMVSPIHTRFIVDPGWAAKFSGSLGKLNFALLAANDRSPGREWEEGSNPDQGKTAFFGILRAKYNLGSDNSVGILYSGRHFSDEQNDAYGIDLKYRFFKNARVSLSYLSTSTTTGQGIPRANGGGLNAMIQFNTPDFSSIAAYERYDTDFYMATAFQNRTGISRGWVKVGPRFNMKIKNLGWLKRVAPYILFSSLHDLSTRMNDSSKVLGLNLGFAPLGEVTVEYRDEKEGWAGISFGKKYLNTSGNIQLFKWLLLTGSLTAGDALYYTIENPFVGSSTTLSLGFMLQPGMKLKLGIDYLYLDLYKKNSEKVYSYSIYNANATYQFNKYFFLRGIVRYNNYTDKLLTDFLASFTLIPGTVIHLGYGSLYLDNRWMNNQWIPGDGHLLKMRQRIFFKASYLLRIK